MDPESHDSNFAAMAGGAALGMFIGTPFGLLIAWLTGMLQGWNWPFVVFQSALVFAMTFAWTAPLYAVPKKGKASIEIPETTDEAARDSV